MKVGVRMYYGDSFADLATMRLEGKIKGIYAQAYREIEEKLNTFLAKSVIKEKEYEAKVQAGKLSQEWFDRWKSGQVFIGKRWRDLRQNIAHEIGNGAYESIFGKGATDLFMTFAKAYREINKASGLNLQYLGLDIRTRAQLGSLISGFMIYKGNFIYNGTQIQDGDPRFELLANRGVFKVIHTPSTPMEIRQDQLAFAKGKE